MNRKEALSLVEDFPDWVGKSEIKEDQFSLSLRLWGRIKAEILVPKIQWFIHVLYLKGYKVTKK